LAKIKILYPLKHPIFYGYGKGRARYVVEWWVRAVVRVWIVHKSPLAPRERQGVLLREVRAKYEA